MTKRAGTEHAGTEHAGSGSAHDEQTLLANADAYSFRARMDKRTAEGPIFVSARGSTVTDIKGKEYLDFNSGQMCSALGHNHPTVVAAIKQAADTMIHAHSSHYNVKEIELATRLGRIMPRPLKKSLFGESGADAMGFRTPRAPSPFRVGTPVTAICRGAPTQSSPRTAIAALSRRVFPNASSPASRPASSCWMRRAQVARRRFSPSPCSAPAA